MATTSPSFLSDELHEYIKKSAAAVGGQKFIPANEKAGVLTRSNIRQELRKSGVLSDPLLDFVIHRASSLFLILVFEERVQALEDLYNVGFDDEALPIGTELIASVSGRASRYRVASLNKTTHQLEKPWPTFEKWSNRQILSLEQNQWLFLAPTFTNDKFFYNVPSDCPLPFVALKTSEPRNNEEKASASGNFSTVYKLAVYGQESPLALKVFREHLKDYFYRELDTLRKIKTLNHQHLVEPIAAFEKGDKRCFVFPWADGGNLYDFWKEEAKVHKQPPIPSRLMLWSLKQMCGLAECLTYLHAQNCRHGDLKPGNILYFKDRDEGGKLVIADFGLAKFHLLDTKQRSKNSSMFDRTLRYEPPEMETENQHPEDKNPRSRNYDVWSMGCIFLEFTIWLVYGWSYLEGFIEANANEMFWKLENGVHVVHPSVQREISKMMEDLKVDVAVRDIVKLVRDRLLVVPPANSKGSQGVTRATVEELFNTMEDIRDRAFEEESYLQAPAVPQRTSMGDRLSVRQKASIPRTSQRNLSVPNDEAAPKILVRAATGDLGEDGQAQQAPVHPQTQTIELNHNWESTPDNDFAIGLFQQVDCSTLKPSSKAPELCSKCESLNLEEMPFELSYDFSVIEKMSESCELCKLLHRGLVDAGLAGRSGKLLRVASTLKAGRNGPPIISIYSDSDTQSPLTKSQVGFPILPDAASIQQFELLRQWLRLCDKTHECLGQITEMPTRVIDVGEANVVDPKLRLVDTGPGCHDKYIALSHCWGNILESETVRAKKSNMDELKQRIDYVCLPKTFQDAVRCAWELGVRYLWIDSICIIQDDAEDWEAESQKMESVFSSAYCTIAASSAKSSVDGMFQVHRKPRTCVTLKSRNSGNIYLCGVIDNFQRDVEESVLNTRGWVFQERALSRRTIHYTSNQVYWECGHGVRCETLGKLRNSMAAFMGDSDFPTSALRYFKGGRILLFQRLYEMYSKRAFTKPTDRSVALLGLEKRLARTFQTKAQYGIVEEYMERGLLWQRETNGKMLTPINHSSDRKVPSWSWMAYTGAIGYLPVPFAETDWCKTHIRYPLGRKSMRRGVGNAMLEVFAGRLTMSEFDMSTRIIRDDEYMTIDKTSLRCVVIGKGRGDGDMESNRLHYVLVIRPSTGDANWYERVGVGRVLARHISEPHSWVVLC